MSTNIPSDLTAFGQSKNTNRLAYAAFAITIATAIVSLLLGWFAFKSSREAILKSVAHECLSISRTIVNQVDKDIDGLGEVDNESKQRRAIEELGAAWGRTQPPYRGSYLCVIEPSGRLAFHSKNPDMIGTDVSQVVVDPTNPNSKKVNELISSRESLAAQNINFRGKPQLVGYCYMPSIDSMVVVHVPANLVESNIDAMTAPWIVALLLIGLVLVPLSIGLIFLSFRSSHRRSEQVNRELFENKELLRKQFSEIELLYQFAPVGLCLVDKEQRFVRINEELAAIDGKSVEDHIGRTVKEILPDIGDQLERLYQEVFDTGMPALNLDIERVDPVSPTEKLNYIVSHYPLMDNEGSVVGISCVVQNVTNRRRAEKELRIRQEAIDRSSMPTCFSDEGYKVTYSNQAFSDLFGFESPQQMLGKKVTDFVAKPELENGINGQLLDSGNWTCEVQSQRVDGRSLDLMVYASVMRDELGVPNCRLMTVWDITQRKISQEQLRLTQHCVDSCTTSIFWIRSDASFFYVNEFASECFGYAPDEWPAMSIFDIDPGYPAESWPAVWESFQKTRTQTFESNIRHRDGDLIPVEITASRLEFEGQEFAFAFITDITDRTMAEQQLRERESQLAHVSRLSTMGEMVAGIAHEIKQPMHAISNFAVASSVALDNIKRGDVSDPSQSEFNLIKELLEWNEGIRHASHRAGEIVARLRSFASKTGERRDLENVSQLLQESIELVAFAANQKQVELTTQIPDGLQNVYCDRIQIQQVLVNLLNNAYDALAHQTSKRSVSVEISANHDQLNFSVSDNGNGINHQTGAKVFDAFYTTKQDGMGIGLTISRTLVEAHGGRIWATENPDGGATFRFTLPMKSFPNDELSSKNLVSTSRD